MRRIAITSGDSDGIGLEVTYKALAQLGPRSGTQFVIWRSPQVDKKIDRLLKSKFSKRILHSAEELPNLKPRSFELLEIHHSGHPADWVKEAAHLCFIKEFAALCTAPMSKVSPGAQLGHTGILQEYAKEPLHMMFVGPHCRVLLATAHIPLKQVSSRLNPDVLSRCYELAFEFRKSLPQGQRKLKIGVLGLNPHAGEMGLIGNEEVEWIQTSIKKGAPKFALRGPLVPDAAFSEAMRREISIYIALYHDQGLIPFKTLHGFDGVHLTLGLPFVRTSVDHGTAKELYGKGRANPASMLMALKWALRLGKDKS